MVAYKAKTWSRGPGVGQEQGGTLADDILQLFLDFKLEPFRPGKKATAASSSHL